MSDDTREPRRASRDERIADDTHASSALMCGATGCPNRWSVDAGNGRLCSAHAWAGRHLWPQITDEQQWAETDRARAAMDAPPIVDHPRRDPERLAKALAKLARQKDGTAWAKRLQWCEQQRGGKLPSGLSLTEFQRSAWRQVLVRIGEPGVEPADSFPATNRAGAQ